MKKTSQLPVQLAPSEHTLICSLAREFWQSNEPVLWLVDGRWLHGRRFMAQAKAAADALERRGILLGRPVIGVSQTAPGRRVMQYALSELGWSIMIDQVRLSQSEFILLRSLAKERWNGRDAILWRINRTWHRLSEDRYLSEARCVLKILERRGLIEHIDCSRTDASSRLNRCSGLFHLSLRGRLFLISANSKIAGALPPRISLLSRIAKALTFQRSTQR